MAELFEIAGTPDPANDRVPYFDASETLVNQLKNCSPRTLVNSGLELQANGDSTSAIVRHTSLGYITGHIPIASPDTLANSLPAGSISGTPVITPGASLLVQFVIASAIGANGYNIYKRRCGKSGATNWRGVEGWELEAYSEFSGTVNLDLALGSWEIAVQTVSDLQTGPITYVFRTDTGTTLSGSIVSATIKQDTSGVLITPVISGTFDFIHVFYRRRRDNGLFGPFEEEIYASTEPVIVIQNMVPGDTWFYLVPEQGEYYDTAHLGLQFNVETSGVAKLLDPIKQEASGLTTATYKTPAEIMGWTAVGMTPELTNGRVVINAGAMADPANRRVEVAQSGVSQVVACMGFSSIGAGHPMWGPMMLDASGNGVGFTFYSNSSSIIVAGITAGIYVSTLSVATLMPGHLSLNAGVGEVWLRLTKSGTTYTGQYSLCGKVWSDGLSATTAGTPTKGSVGQFYRNGAGSIVSSKLIIHGAAIE